MTEHTINKVRNVVYKSLNYTTGITDFVVKIRKPNGLLLSPDPTIVEQGSGIYTFSYTPDALGNWQEKITSASNGDNAFNVVKTIEKDHKDLSDEIAAISGGGGGGNPDGGAIDIAVINYKTALMQQWASLTIGSASAPLLNLLNSELELFNLASSTFLYNNTNLKTNPANSNYWVAQTAGGSRLAGVLTPTNLKMSLHYQGLDNTKWVSGGGVGIIDTPTYAPNYTVTIDSTNSQAVPNYFSAGGLFPYNQFVGGTPSAIGNAVANVANAFDGDSSTFATLTSSSATASITYDLGVAKILTTFYYKVTVGSSGGWLIRGSNDGTNFTTIITSGASGSADRFLTSSNTTAYRYYRLDANTSASTCQVYEFMGFLSINDVFPVYSTSQFQIGNSSIYFNGGVYQVASGTAHAMSIYDYNFQFKGYFRFSDLSTTKNLFTILNSLEIQASASNLILRYSTNGSTFTNLTSSTISLSTNTWYYLSIRRTGNTLYFFVDGVAAGTADMTGISIFQHASGSPVRIGTDTANTSGNLFKGYMQEVEFFQHTTDVDTASSGVRTTAFIPPVDIYAKNNFIPSSATELTVLLFLDEVTQAAFGVPIVNTDLILQLSCNGGTNWHTVTLTKTSALSTLTNVYDGTLNLTGVTNTNNFTYRITNAAGKVMKFDGLIAYWS